MEVSRGSKIRLSIVPITHIKPHERTIRSLLESIKNNMYRTGFQRDPILVDERSHFALDGMHRLEALKILGAKFALCAEFNLREHNVKLERWLRTFIAPSSGFSSSIVDMFQMIPFANFRAAARKVEKEKRGIALLSRQQSFVGARDWNMRKIYFTIAEVDKLCERSKVELHFSTESEKFRLFSSESVELLYPPKLSKKQVMRFAKRHELLPYKTTRYSVPIRPMGIYFPLAYLKENTLRECSLELERIVKLSKVNVEKRNVWYEGRRYSESLAIFRRKRRERNGEDDGRHRKV